MMKRMVSTTPLPMAGWRDFHFLRFSKLDILLSISYTDLYEFNFKKIGKVIILKNHRDLKNNVFENL